MKVEIKAAQKVADKTCLVKLVNDEDKYRNNTK